VTTPKRMQLRKKLLEADRLLELATPGSPEHRRLVAQSTRIAITLMEMGPGEFAAAQEWVAERTARA
jgi:hypothetical protein